jgi:Rod binding domain-containing protein
MLAEQDVLANRSIVSRAGEGFFVKSSPVPPKLTDQVHHQKNDDPRITPEMRKAAEGLESVFTSEMVKAMRGTVEESEFSLHNSASDIYQGMLDQEYADVSAKGNSLGLSQQIIDYWLRSQPQPKYTNNRSQGTGGTHED